jgi:AAA+ ATPase superfamily predicted ATPase
MNDYFDLAVKTHRQDLFDRESEFQELKNYLNDPLTVVLGMRRLGKSSLIAVALDSQKSAESIMVDLRGVGPNPSPIKVLERFEHAINSLKSKRLWEKLSSISGVSLFSFGIQFSKSNKSRPTLQSLMDSIQDYVHAGGEKFIVAVDEVQEARGLSELTAAFAHAYDYNKDIRLILAGSEVGVLHDFIGIDDPDSHLYGRKINYVELQKFPRELSLEFLTRGFEAYKKKVQSADLEQALNKLDGIVGWLVLYGHEVVNARKPPSLQGIVDQAVKMVEAESSKIIAKSKHYRYILKALAESGSEMRWKNIYDFVELKEGHVSENAFNDALMYLTKYGIVKKNLQTDAYAISDPIIVEYARKL